MVTNEKVVNHFAISSLFDGGDGEKKIFSYRVENIVMKIGEEETVVVGQVRVSSEVNPEPKEFLFGLIPSKKAIFGPGFQNSRVTFF